MSDLQARYGRTAGKLRRDRLTLIILGGFIALVFLAWVVWAGLGGGGGASLESRDLGYTDVSEHSVTVMYEITVPPGDAVTCALQALSPTFAIVGWKIVDVPASDQITRQFSTPVRTTQLSTTGLIYRCWVV